MQKSARASGRRARSRFSSLFNVAAIGGKSPRTTIGSRNLGQPPDGVKRAGGTSSLGFGTVRTGPPGLGADALALDQPEPRQLRLALGELADVLLACLLDRSALLLLIVRLVCVLRPRDV